MTTIVEQRINKITFRLAAFLGAALYVPMAAVQVTGMLKCYSSTNFIICASVIILLYLVFARVLTSPPIILNNTFQDGTSLSKGLIVDMGLLSCGLILFAGRVLFPITAWPMSSYGYQLNPDTALYHLPKAIELWKSGSLWDTSVLFWQYPSGYEGLLSLSYVLTGSEALLGLMHALIVLYFSLILLLLVRRYTSLPVGFSFLLITLCLVFSPLRSTVFELGKNDFLLAASCMAVLLYSPLGSHARDRAYDLLLLSSSSMIMMSTKPNGGLILILAWGWVLWREMKSEDRHPMATAFRFFLAALMMVPGILWVIRNVAIQGALFSSDLLEQASWSIVNNLGNMYWYAAVHGKVGFRLLLLSVGFIITCIWACARYRRPSVAQVMVLVLTFIMFIVTPCSAWGNSSIQWRFGVSFIAYSLVMGFCLLEPLIRRLLPPLERSASLVIYTVVVITLLSSGSLLWRWRAHMRLYPDRVQILHEWFTTPVGTNGYYSAYDFVRRSTSGVNITLHEGFPLFLYGVDYKNHVKFPRESGDQSADYAVLFLPRADIYTEQHPGETRQFPDFISGSDWLRKWILVYADREGKVYKRR